MVVCRWTTQAEFRAMLVGVVLCVPNRFQFRLGTRLELEIPRNPTVVLFLKIPRVLCSHPLTGGPGFYFVMQVEDLRGRGKPSPPSGWLRPACSTVRQVRGFS